MPDAVWLILLLVALGLCLLVLRRRRASDDEASQATAPSAPERAPVDAVGAHPPAETEEADLPSNQISVDAVEPLTEAQIYLSFGYARRAADTLRACVESNEAVASEVLETLCRLYLELGTLDDYCDILMRRKLSASELETAIRVGLQVDRNHLGLRVLAEERLQLGPDAFAAADALTVATRAVAVPTPVPAPVRPPAAVRTPPTGGAPCLVDGGDAVLRTLSRDETRVIRLFVPPKRRVRLLMAAGDSDNALPALRAALAQTPDKPALLIDLLQVHYRHHNIDAYVLTLWQLFVALGEHGAALREKLLHFGLALGYHPALAPLAQADSRLALQTIGQRYGFSRSRTPPRVKLSLVEKQQPQAMAAVQASILQDADAYLTFGQLDEAMALLEGAIAASPAQPEFYPPLLELYEKLEDLPRARALQRQTQQCAALPDEIGAMINALVSRLQRPAEVA